MNLSDILGSVTGLANAYVNYRALRSGAVPRPYTPVTPVGATPGIIPTTPTGFFDSDFPWTGGIVDWLDDTPAAPQPAPRSVPVQISNRAARAAAAAGVSPEQAAFVLAHCRPRRRRKRMLTKSDVADISTMAALLGKSSESFRTWLAGAVRR